MSVTIKRPTKPARQKAGSQQTPNRPASVQLKAPVGRRSLAPTPFAAQTQRQHAALPGARAANHRPQLAPGCLQLKAAEALAIKQARKTPAIYQPNPLPRVLQSQLKAEPAINRIIAPARITVPPARVPNRTVQRFTSRVIQAVKFYPNLHPGAVEPVDSSNIFKLNSFANQYRLHKVHSHGVNVPNQQYNFVRTREGDMLLHSRYRHPSIAEGKQVLYAGEIFFNNGELKWWSNGSGHYQPYPEDAEQANLPMDSFYSYQQIIKGEHTRKKG